MSAVLCVSDLRTWQHSWIVSHLLQGRSVGAARLGGSASASPEATGRVTLGLCQLKVTGPDCLLQGAAVTCLQEALVPLHVALSLGCWSVPKTRRLASPGAGDRRGRGGRLGRLRPGSHVSWAFTASVPASAAPWGREDGRRGSGAGVMGSLCSS